MTTEELFLLEDLEDGQESDWSNPWEEENQAEVKAIWRMLMEEEMLASGIFFRFGFGASYAMAFPSHLLWTGFCVRDGLII